MKYFLAAILLLLSAACVKRDSIRYVTLPAKPVEQVALLPGPPNKPFKVVGHVFIDGANSRSWQTIAEAAKAEAADMGADAVFYGADGRVSVRLNERSYWLNDNNNRDAEPLGLAHG